MNDIIKLSPRFYSVCIGNKTKSNRLKNAVLRNTRISVYVVCVSVFFAKTKTTKREKVQTGADYQKPTHHKSTNQSISQQQPAAEEAVSGHEASAHSCLTTYFHSPCPALRRQHTPYAITQTSLSLSRARNSSNSPTRRPIRRLLFTHKVPLIVRYLATSAAAAAWYTISIICSSYLSSSNHHRQQSLDHDETKRHANERCWHTQEHQEHCSQLFRCTD